MSVPESGNVTTDFDLLHCRLEAEWKSLMERLSTDFRPSNGRQQGNYRKSEDEAATESLELWRRMALEQRIRDQLTEVEHALRKFEAGSYGLCDICGQPIEPERLEALPQTSLCFSCKACQAKQRG